MYDRGSPRKVLHDLFKIDLSQRGPNKKFFFVKDLFYFIVQMISITCAIPVSEVFLWPIIVLRTIPNLSNNTVHM